MDARPRARAALAAALLITAFIGDTATAADESVTARIRTLVSERNAAQAYALASEHSASEMGDPEFDFWFGLAALEAGNPGEAVFALERVLIAQPAHHRARLELARAHYLLKDYPAARTEFLTVLKYNPPENVRNRVDMFIGAIDKRIAEQRREWHGRASLAYGYDDNVNAATAVESVDVPAFPTPIALDGASRETADQFTELSAAGDFKYNLNQKVNILGMASVKQRNNLDSNVFDNTNAGISAAWRYSGSVWKLTVPVQFQQINLQGSVLRRMTTLTAQWNRALDQSRDLAFFAQAGKINYPDQAARDATTYLGGASYSLRSNNATRLYSANLFYGSEGVSHELGKHNGRDYLGARFGLQYIISPTTLASLFATYQSVEHAAVDPVFVKVRKDEFYQLTAGLTWRLNKSVTAQFDVEAYVNDSNVALYEYDRTLIRGAVSYAF